VEEWKANTFDNMNVFRTPEKRKVNSMDAVKKRVRKLGEYFQCNKPGNFAKECQIAGKTRAGNSSNTSVKVSELEQKTYKCYKCGEMEHKRPDCPNKAKKNNKKVKLTT